MYNMSQSSYAPGPTEYTTNVIHNFAWKPVGIAAGSVFLVLAGGLVAWLFRVRRKKRTFVVQAGPLKPEDNCYNNDPGGDGDYEEPDNDYVNMPAVRPQPQGSVEASKRNSSSEGDYIVYNTDDMDCLYANYDPDEQDY